MPPKTRASAISATASEKLENVRVPGRTSEVTLNDVFSPNAAATMNAAEPLTVEWPDGYSGCAGVPGGKKINKVRELFSQARDVGFVSVPLWRPWRDYQR